MTRPLARFVVAAFCLLSLLACVGTGWLWWRSHRAGRGGEDAVTRYFAGRQARYTLVSRAGRLTVYAPPAAPAIVPPRYQAPNEPSPQEAAAAVRNDQVEWEIVRSRGDPRGGDQRGGSPRPFASPRVAGEGLFILAATIERPWYNPPSTKLAPAHYAPWLLLALEDPERFVAAHLLLMDLYSTRADRLEDRPDGSVLHTADGLRAELRADESFPPMGMSNAPDDVIQRHVARVDPAQLAALRAQWHRRLDAPLGSVPHSWLVCGTAVPPLLWLGTRGRRLLVRRRRRRSGLCLRCGYDMRGSPGRCSECGTVSGVKEA